MIYSSSVNQEMDRWERYRRERENPNPNPNPSFSSTLLDTIYRSIDEDNIVGGEREEEVVFYRETMRKKSSNCSFKSNTAFDEDMASLQRACMIEKWMEKKKVSEKLVVRRNSAPNLETNRRDDHGGGGRAEISWFLNSSSSSSDSSSGGGFSSSEAESVYGHPARSSTGGGITHRLSPIRTGSSAQHEKSTLITKHDQSGFKCSKKSKALKNIYGDLKKVKQPISPGSRLSSFLNSIFNAGNAKKAKVSSSSSSPEIKYSNSMPSSTCSSATSFSRSCLSKTPSSRGTLSNGTKRSVRFYPISVIVDEDCRPCGHKSLYEDEPSLEKIKDIRNSINDELQLHIMEKHRRVEEAARELLRNYQKKVECEFDMRSACNSKNDNGDEDEYDDGASCASSDLFELDNLSAIGIDRYREELPVYETTHLDTNRAIANGLLV